MLRAHVLTGGDAVVVTGRRYCAAGRRAARRDTRQRFWNLARNQAGRRRRPEGPLHDGIIIGGANLVIVTETDLTGNRATAVEGKRLAAKRPAVDRWR